MPPLPPRQQRTAVRRAGLPEGLGALPLRGLEASHNALTQLPEALGEVATLASLVAGDNRLAALPAALGAYATGLAAVAAPNNAITRLPPGLARAAALVRLNLSGNRVAELPADILVGLTSLQARGCCVSRRFLRGAAGGRPGGAQGLEGAGGGWAVGAPPRARARALNHNLLLLTRPVRPNPRRILI